MLELAPSTEHDRYFDYCLEAYRPRRPWPGKARSENLLFHALEVGAASEALAEPLRAVQAHVGRDLTVWGVKWDGTRLWWELYFYDPQKEHPNSAISSIREVAAPFFRVVPAVSETVPYMMVSFDLDASSRGGTIDALNLYLTGEKAHAGRSFVVTAEGTELHNTYRFMEPKPEIDEVLTLIESSAFVDYSDPTVLSKVLIPELFACKKVCVSKKRDRDAIYFSGIDVDQLLWFLRRFDYPAETTGFIEKHHDAFEHLYFDVGIDYRHDENGQLVYPKTSYYGTL